MMPHSRADSRRRRCTSFLIIDVSVVMFAVLSSALALASFVFESKKIGLLPKLTGRPSTRVALSLSLTSTRHVSYLFLAKTTPVNFSVFLI